MQISFPRAGLSFGSGGLVRPARPLETVDQDGNAFWHLYRWTAAVQNVGKESCTLKYQPSLLRDIDYADDYAITVTPSAHTGDSLTSPAVTGTTVQV
jgi:hypothetical protein